MADVGQFVADIGQFVAETFTTTGCVSVVNAALTCISQPLPH